MGHWHKEEEMSWSSLVGKEAEIAGIKYKVKRGSEFGVKVFQVGPVGNNTGNYKKMIQRHGRFALTCSFGDSDAAGRILKPYFED